MKDMRGECVHLSCELVRARHGGAGKGRGGDGWGITRL